MNTVLLMLDSTTTVAPAASRDDLPVKPPVEPQYIWQDVVHAIGFLSIVMSPEGEGYE